MPFVVVYTSGILRASNFIVGMPSEITKPHVVQAEGPNPTPTTDSEDAGGLPSMVPSDPDEYEVLERGLVRKIDWRLMPVLVAMIILK